MTRKQHRKDKEMRLKLKETYNELNFKPEECDPEHEENKFKKWKESFLLEIKENVFMKKSYA